MRENPPSPLLQWSFWKCKFGWVCSWNCSAWLPNGPGLSHPKILVNGGKGVNWQGFQFLAPKNCIYKIAYFQIFPKIFPRGVWIRIFVFLKNQCLQNHFLDILYTQNPLDFIKMGGLHDFLRLTCTILLFSVLLCNIR